jgi:hypothetical protein
MMRASGRRKRRVSVHSRPAMRWLLLVLTVFAFTLCFTRHSTGAWGFWLLIGVIGIVATTLAFAQARIAGNARNDSLSEYDLKRLREGKDPLNHSRSTSER